MLLREHARGERVFGVAVDYRYRRLNHDRAVIEFGREQVDVPFRLRLARDGVEAVITADGLGSFRLD